MPPRSKAAITRAYAALEQRALANWDALWHGEKPVIIIGGGSCGRATGALEVLAAARDSLVQYDVAAAVFEAGCLGHCYAEPVVIVRKPGAPAVAYARVNPVIMENIVREFLLAGNPLLEFVLAALEPNDLIPSFDDFPRAQIEKKVVLGNCGRIDPENIEHSIAAGGYAALAQALVEPPEAIINEVKDSGLRGRGGAGFPTGLKMAGCRGAPSEAKYVICNADEGDPGAFMDRLILESDPHAVIEGLVLAAYAIGAGEGYIYVRSEYPLAVARLETAVVAARATGLLGKDILCSGFDFEVAIFTGSGAFVCGEETALISSMEGYPGLPRQRPPYPAEKGLYGQPTLIHNVKTLANLPQIVKRGAAWFRGIGTASSPGTAIFALAGKVIGTGLTEVPMGTTLRQVIYDVGSGVARGRRFKAVQIGGPSGGCLPETALDLPIDFESLSDVGAMMGSGGMVVLDEDDCMVEIARYFLDFTEQESCGKCSFCRLGTRQMLARLQAITEGKGQSGDIEILAELAGAVKTGSLCGLGQTAPNPVLTTLRYFRDEYEAHINQARCPALMCLPLISYYIDPRLCQRSCEACVGPCTVEAISSNQQRIKVIDQNKCVKCGICLTSCPPDYHAVLKYSPLSTAPDCVPPVEAAAK